jgi:deoxyadenosine/deoxycytidine kinase
MAECLVSITGNTATGTTTLAERLGQMLGWETVFSESYLNHSPFFANFLQNPQRWAFHNQGFFIAEYVTMYQTAIQSPAHQAGVLCLDYAISELVVYTDAMRKMGFLTEEEYGVLCSYLHLFRPHFRCLTCSSIWCVMLMW